MRLYTFVNFYLSSIQQGIQSAHVVHSLFVKYPQRGNTPEAPGSLLWEWAEGHKTMIVLNGGTNFDLRTNFELLVSLPQLQLPYQCFCEDDVSLGGVMTSFGVVVPQRFYDAKLDPDTGEYFYDSDPENVNSVYNRHYTYEKDTAGHRFITMLKSCGLAR